MGSKDVLWMCTMWMMTLVQAGSTTQFPDITDGKFIEDCLRGHNLNRSKVNPPASKMRYMTWDAALAITARAWAKFCVFKHNIYLKDVKKVHPTFESVGENIWTGCPPGTFTVEGAMKSWVDEELINYDYNSNTCQPNKMCGHYTQVVWANSYKVGCAVHLCPNGVKGFVQGQDCALFVCNYSPAGNWRGDKPYKSGAPCTGCGGETCEKSLCRDPIRDETKHYWFWSPEWDPDKASCGASCVALLVIRPLLLLATFGSVAFIQTQYPNMFVYE